MTREIQVTLPLDLCLFQTGMLHFLNNKDIDILKQPRPYMLSKFKYLRNQLLSQKSHVSMTSSGQQVLDLDLERQVRCLDMIRLTDSRITSETRDAKFGIQIGLDWPQIGKIWDFLRSVSVHFGAVRQNVLKLIFKKSQICPIWGPI